MTQVPESKGFKIAQWLHRAFTVAFSICAVAFIVGAICLRQIESRSAEKLSPEHPYRVVLSKSDGTPYHLSRSDYFWCQQLGIYATYGLAASGILSAGLGYCLDRRRRA